MHTLRWFVLRAAFIAAVVAGTALIGAIGAGVGR